MENEYIGNIVEVRLRKNGPIAINLTLGVRTCSSSHEESTVILDEATSDDCWILASAFKDAAVVKFDRECGGSEHAEIGRASCRERV